MYEHDFRSYMHACYRESPRLYAPVWAASIAAVVAVCILSHNHLKSLRRQPISARQQLYLSIAWMPIVFSLSSALSIFAPRSALLWWLLQQQYEAFALSAFGSLLFLLLALVARADSSSANVGLIGDRMLSLLAAGGRKKHFASPPVCCLCK